MNKEQKIQQHYRGSKPLLAHLQEGVLVGFTECLFYPFSPLQVFYRTKDAHPYLIKNNISLNSVLDFYSYFKKRHGSYKIFNCFGSGALSTFTEQTLIHYKRYYFSEVFKYKDSYVPDLSTGKLPEITVREAIKYMLTSFGFDVLISAIFTPVNTLYIKMVADYDPVRQYDHIVDCFCKTVEKDGFGGLFKSFVYLVLKRFMESAFDAFLYYKNQPNSNSDYELCCEVGKSWGFLAFDFLTLAVIYPINRFSFCSMIGADPELKFDGSLFDGFWIPCLFMSFEVVAKLVEVFQKKRLNE